jgi:hypothetical protein
MEYVEVPNYIPKSERDLFRDALIAVHGGKTLAGFFYLRTFIEQFARRLIGETGRRFGDELMEEYGKTLPPDQRDMMPSLREWYGRLSESIHLAKADEVVFEKARDAIEQHFDMRRVFRIPEEVTAIPPEGSTK